jgi:SAM-dependent methyltransferase
MSDLAVRLHAAFLQSAEAALTYSFERLSQVRFTSNLFVWQNILMELGTAHELTGDDRFLVHGRRLICRLADDQGWASQNFVEEIHAAFVLNGIVDFWSRTAAAWSPEEDDALRALLREQGKLLWADAQRSEWGRDVRKRNAWNHTAVAFSGLAAVGLVLDDEEGTLWAETGLDRIRLFFRDGVTASGMTWEGLAYCGFVFRNLSVPLHLARDRGLWDYLSEADNPDLAKLRRVPHWYAADLFPSGSWLQSWNDSYWNPHPALKGFVTTFGVLDPECVAEVWHRTLGPAGRGTFGVDPSFRDSSICEAVRHADLLLEAPRAGARPLFFCPEIGYAASGTSASAPGTSLSFNSGEYIGAIHDQADNNSFTLFLDGFPAIIEGGAANIPEEGSNSSTFGHNGIVVDGRGQFPCGHGRGCSGRIHSVTDDDRSFYAVGDATRAYNLRDYNPVERAIRHVLLSKDGRPYALVVDDFLSRGGQEVSALFHTPVLAEAVVDDARQAVSGRLAFAGRDATLSLRLLHPRADRIEHATRESPHQPPFERHDCWSFTTIRQREPFVMLVELAVDASSDPEWRDGRVTVDTGEIRVHVTAGGGDEPEVRVFPRTASLAAPYTPPTPSPTPTPSTAGPTVSPPDPISTYTQDEMATGLFWRTLREARADSEQAGGLMRALTAQDYPKPPERGVVMGHSGYREIGLEFFRYFLRWGDLAPEDRVLDIGCGGGRMAVPLLYYLAGGGRYVGFDVHRESIDWCNAQLAPRSGAFSFDFFDLGNSSYNRAGTGRAEEFTFPYADGAFTFIVSTSVFTHMTSSEVARYLEEMSRVLAPGGRAFCTAYLMTPEARASMERSPGAVKMTELFGDNLVQSMKDPMAAVAQDEPRFRSDVARVGLALDRVAFGWWSGLRTSNTKQDLILLRK